MKKPIYVAIGAAVAIVGAVFLLNEMGIINLNLPLSYKLAVAPQGSMGITINTDVKSYPYPLATVARGVTYKWKMDLKNTGTINWEQAWVTIRVGVNGASVVDKTEPGIAGTFKVEQCSAGTDVIACRVDLSSAGWNLQESIDGQNWYSPSGGCADRVCSIGVLTSINAGQTLTRYFRLTVPTTASEGNYPLITNGMAYASGTYAVASKTDNLSVGTMSGDLVITLIGTLALVGGVASIIVGIK
jgi:hypothetical protein